MMMKLVIFFGVSFVIILTLMTILVGILQAPADTPGTEPQQNIEAPETPQDSASQSITTPNSGNPSPLSDAAAQPAMEKNLDSLAAVIEQYKDENQKLRKSSRQKAKPAEALPNAKKVAKIYEKMAAEEAANILAGLQTELAAEIIASMKQRQAAKILALMDHKQAVVISKKIATLN